MADIDSKALHILQHSLGLNQYGPGNAYRNHFVTGPGSADFETCRSLVESGLMLEQKNHPLCGGDSLFTVTGKGREVVALQRPAPPALAKLTRSQKRYRDYLRSDCGLSFGEWLRGR